MVSVGGTAVAGCAVTTAATLPLRVEGRHLVTSLTIEGVTVTALVDTGSAVTAIDRALATRLGLRRDASRRAAITGIAGRSRVRIDTVVASRLSLGTLALGDMPLVSGDFNAGRPAGFRVDAILGADILGRYDLDVDPARGRLVLSLVEGCVGRFVDWATVAVPLAPLAEQRLHLVPVTIDGHTLMALVDTGATESVLFEEGIRRMGASLKPDPADGSGYGIGAEAGRRVRVTLHRFGTLRLGEETVADPTIAVARARPMALDMILGLDILGRRRFWLSYATKQLFLAAP